MTKGLVAAAAAALTIPLIGGPAFAASSSSSGRVVLTDSAPSWASASTDLGALPASTLVEMRVYLTANGGESALEAAVLAASSPGSATYQHFLSPQEYVAKYGPSTAEVASVSAYLRSSGLTVAGVAAGSRYLYVTGTAAEATTAFGATLHYYKHNGTTEQSPSTDVSLPNSIAPQVLGVTGLSTPQPMTHSPMPAESSTAVSAVSSSATSTDASTDAGIDSRPPSGFRNARPCSAAYGQIAAAYEADGKTPLPQFQGKTLDYATCGYVPSQYRSAYGVSDTTLTGKGVTVAITDAYASSTMPSDANTYATEHGDPAFTSGQYTESFPSEPMRHRAQCGPSGWSGEQTLDIEAVHGIALDANVKYYAARSCYDSDLLDSINRVIDDNIASYITNSWGSPSSEESAGSIHAYEQAFLQAGMQGIGVLFSSGDSGDDLASTGIKQTDYPTSDPWVTSVGGTTDAIGSDGTFIGQDGWGTEKYVLSESGKAWTPVADNPFIYGAGGGFSTLFNRPDYQEGVIPAGSPAGRAVPDIAMDADPTTGMLVGQTQIFPDGRAYGEFRIGGTSLASPLMAGMQALANQAAGSRLGFANPRIYDLARTGSGAITDVTNFRPAGNVRPDYVNGDNPTGGIVYSVRTFGQDSSLKTAKGWDPVTGVGSPNSAYIMGTNR